MYQEAEGSGRYAVKSLEWLAHVLAQTGHIAQAKGKLFPIIRSKALNFKIVLIELDIIASFTAKERL